jgi:hypothetical protein
MNRLNTNTTDKHSKQALPLGGGGEKIKKGGYLPSGEFSLSLKGRNY